MEEGMVLEYNVCLCVVNIRQIEYETLQIACC
jgi:hypothetical protein